MGWGGGSLGYCHCAPIHVVGLDQAMGAEAVRSVLNLDRLERKWLCLGCVCMGEGGVKDDSVIGT